MLPSIRPISLHCVSKVLWTSDEIYSQAKAVSIQCCVSACSASLRAVCSTSRKLNQSVYLQNELRNDVFAPSGFQLVKLTAQRARSPVENSSSHFNRFPLDFLRLNSFQRAWFLVSQHSQAMSNHGRSLWVDFTCPLLCMDNLFSRLMVWPI